MKFFIADSFHESLLNLPKDIQKSAKNTVYDLQQDSSMPGLNMHRVQKSKDPNFWSVRVNQDCRIIIHKTNESILLCYVDKHDPSYKWAERRKLTVHPNTGAAQIVVIKEEEQVINVPVYVEEKTQISDCVPVLENVSKEELLIYGVPEENIDELKSADENSILNIIVDMPGEAAEVVLQLAAGIKPEIPVFNQLDQTDPFEHPDAKRRFRVVDNIEELEHALESDWEKWMVFLHPVQRQLVQQVFTGPVRVSGTAGTGKTVVALHRAVYLARKSESARILLTTFSSTLAKFLKIKLNQLITKEPQIAERVEVISLNSLANHWYTRLIGQVNIPTDSNIKQILTEILESFEKENFNIQFLIDEWKQVIDEWQINSWEDYRTVPRIGRKVRLPESKRAAFWPIFELLKIRLVAQGYITESGMYQSISKMIKSSGKLPYTYAVIDEAQDVSVAQLRFLAVLGGNRPNNLFFTGDLGQRIFQQPFSWLHLGIDIRGRSNILKVNYRTSHQIRSKLEFLLDSVITDADGISEDRTGAISVFNGSDPIILRSNSKEDEILDVSKWIKSHIENSVKAHEIAIFTRSKKEINRAITSVTNLGLDYVVLDKGTIPARGKVSLGTMHNAKGLEFKAVAVMACDYNVVPSPKRLEEIIDESDIIEVMNTERHLLYVACTRARDFLHISGVKPVSQFIDDLEQK